MAENMRLITGCGPSSAKVGWCFLATIFPLFEIIAASIFVPPRSMARTGNPYFSVSCILDNTLAYLGQFVEAGATYQSAPR